MHTSSSGNKSCLRLTRKTFSNGFFQIDKYLFCIHLPYMIHENSVGT